jgi:hypothetical protein
MSPINIASTLVPGADNYLGDVLYVLNSRPNGANNEIRLQKSWLADMFADVTHSYTLTSLLFSNVGGRLAASTSGNVFSCLHDVLQNVKYGMTLLLMEPPSSINLANVKKIDLNGYGLCADVQLDANSNSAALFLTYSATGFKLL